MDDLDTGLIAELRRDGRASISELAERLKVSRATVRTRLERLKEAGEIVLSRYGDRRVQTDENAAGLLTAYTTTFGGQIRAGWALAHER